MIHPAAIVRAEQVTNAVSTSAYYTGRSAALRRPSCFNYPRNYNQGWYTANTTRFGTADLHATSRVYYIANCDCTDLQPLFGNYIITSGTGENANTNAITVKASYEWNSTTYPVTWNGQTSIVLPAGVLAIPVPDPFPIHVTSGTSVPILTYVSVANNGEKWPIGPNAGAVNSGETFNYCQYGFPVSAATNASPIEITTSTHGMSNGDAVFVSGALGNTAANTPDGSLYYVTVTATNKVTLYSDSGRTTPVAGNGTYTANSAKIVRMATSGGTPVAGADKTGTAGALPNTGNYVYGPLSILATPKNGLNRRTTMCLGDSIQCGQNAYPDDGYNLRKFRTNNLSYHHCGRGGDKLLAFMGGASTLNMARLALLGDSTDLYIQQMTNDITSSQTLSQLQTNIFTAASFATHRGCRTWVQTVLPLTDVGTAPAASQTPVATSPVRTALNDWLRDGCPYNTSTLVAAAVGATGSNIVRCKVYSSTGVLLRGCDTNHPFLGGGVVDPCGVIEVDSTNALTFNGGRVYCGAGNNVAWGDGTHPNTTCVGYLDAGTWFPASEFV